MERTNRLYYIDNLRTLLITLIMLLHIGITYGGPGSWYYREVEFGSQSLPVTILSALLSATVQAFSLGVFFMVAAYFTAASLDRKGPRRFLADRFMRLGIPLVIFTVFLNPMTIYLANAHLWDPPRSFTAYIQHYFTEGAEIGTGPLWFVAALLLFSLAYLCIRRFGPHQQQDATQSPRIPGTGAMILFTVIIGIISFVIRIWLPVGWSLRYLGFQFPHFTQYIGMFTVGVLAYRGGWFDDFPKKRGIHWFLTAMVLIIIFPVIMYIGGAASERGDELFVGGMHWQSLVYSVWEQLVCVGMAAGLIVILREWFNSQATIHRAMAKSAYTVYIIHAPLVVAVSVMLRGIALAPPVKLLVIAPISIVLCFVLANLIRKLPLANRIL